MTHGYESGRLDLPFVGLASFGKHPVCLDWDRIDTDAAVPGAPFDRGTQWRSGARSGPRAIREASTLFAFGHAGACDHEDGITHLPAAATRIVDIGDAGIVHTGTKSRPSGHASSPVPPEFSVQNDSFGEQFLTACHMLSHHIHEIERAVPQG
jgi:hypothetical protein